MHGSLEAYHKIKELVKPDDELFCLGDCGDRGPQPWETLKAVTTDPQITLLKGNHEDMLAQAIKSYMDNDHQISPLDLDVGLLIQNGGLCTLQDWIADGENYGWHKFLSNLPTHLRIINSKGQEILLSHAGYTPPIELVEEEDLVWDRTHFYDKWPIDYENTFVLHGHSPKQYVAKKLGLDLTDGAFKYCLGHKIDIDCGTYFTGEVVLFNLDTFEEQAFLVKEF